MADAPRSPVAFAPYRDSVDETAPLIPDDTEAGAASGGHAEPGAPGTQDGRASRRLDYRATIISSQVLFVASAIFLLFGGVAVTLILTLHGDSFKPSWRMEGIVQILSLTVRPLLSFRLHQCRRSFANAAGDGTASSLDGSVVIFG